ncbi:PilX N-terminal domain-containing pilus assembly protein [Gilvimarinus sp. SDUM040013]|uniref:PilX N-terminal domain-containing pilus assembly protein n=1 Tax=Gilvimarinus gilvus TaxID=3058038 RepID=A0ABU4S0K9_9GAMM|nr:PilX N-terminal domain-containing pilus assembly protein [Gilvimarinus sp. SDUM040013]MDO3384881.1 PilX N-terminal domain-containing pilus assembly protein [Gilvimarinus sp. SDUM040013]MDX6850694.1 PilX N-terminal domain-containing pilus assembly protein [Gilvimarinus sp. SDUM040013]
MQSVTYYQQRGATIIVGLIMLLALTIVGLSAIRGTALQEQMAGNMRDRQLAFQASEAALREAEAELIGGVAAVNLNAVGFQEMFELQDTPVLTSTAFWEDFDTHWKAQTAAYSEDIPSVSEKPRYLVEEISFYGSGLDGNANDFASLMKAGMDIRYRVTSRSVGGSTDAQVIVQSTYRNEI